MTSREIPACLDNEILYLNLGEKPDECIVLKEVLKNIVLDSWNQHKREQLALFSNK